MYKKKLKDFSKVPMVRISIDTHHPSGAGRDPRRYKEREIPAQLASNLYGAGLISWDIIDNMYSCWEEQWKEEWSDPKAVAL